MTTLQRSLTPLLLAVLLIFAPAALSQTVVSPDQALQLARGGQVTIIDIRRPDEWRQSGLPAGAERATVRLSRGPNKFLHQIAKLTQGDKSKPIALICAAGVRFGYAAKLLASRGYTQVMDISEGMLGNGHGAGWLARDLPISIFKDCR
ncbi:MAG: rhodanese-like domain-containing protein [Alphaproteobacteria bacterium]|nr:rhodanese-like domain-containing protein [Alphaproteobacteria bacterium]